ncbi:hypothetical protein [Sphingobium scionense]|jgi:hypothetical protein|uniref:Uncharacterized protein n=1 Tax=Sphingobium scionense TaxID=1404341 RepID=A0A7W6PWF4_9SPHN|nr:hypothetical protein [Sphingobium scionense]MBB4147855.1 hypothetical protein [Sphingobium scionense]
MSERIPGQESVEPEKATNDVVAPDLATPSRRQLLMGGAVAASAIVSIRPALANTAASVLNCTIPVPDPSRSGNYIAPNGQMVPAGTPGAFPATGRTYTGEQVKQALRGRPLPGTSYEQNQAYLNYIRRLQSGQSGFTCFASLQMPR